MIASGTTTIAASRALINKIARRVKIVFALRPCRRHRSRYCSSRYPGTPVSPKISFAPRRRSQNTKKTVVKTCKTIDAINHAIPRACKRLIGFTEIPSARFRKVVRACSGLNGPSSIICRAQPQHPLRGSGAGIGRYGRKPRRTRAGETAGVSLPLKRGEEQALFPLQNIPGRGTCGKTQGVMQDRRPIPQWSRRNGHLVIDAWYAGVHRTDGGTCPLRRHRSGGRGM